MLQRTRDPPFARVSREERTEKIHWIATKRRLVRRNCAGGSPHQDNRLWSVAEAGRACQTWSGTLAGIGEGKPIVVSV